MIFTVPEGAPNVACDGSAIHARNETKYIFGFVQVQPGCAEVSDMFSVRSSERTLAMPRVTPLFTAGLAAFATAGVVALSPGNAVAAGSPPLTVAYLRGGNVYVATGSTQRQLTTDQHSTRPRWSPDGARIAYLSNGALWTMRADGTGKTQVARVAAGGASWSPDGRWLAYPGPDCNGVLDVLKVPADGGTPVSLIPTSPCAGRPSRSDQIGTDQQAGGTLAQLLRRENAVAWSPDGTKIAFRGGACVGVYDDCLSVVTLATGAQLTLDGYGGGPEVFNGFGVIPVWRPDGVRLSWTAYLEGESDATSQPVHVVETDTTGQSRHTVGVANDRELVYAGAGRAVVTSNHNGGSWVTMINLTSGARTYLRPGSQAVVKP
jgi:TolB protein